MYCQFDLMIVASPSGYRDRETNESVIPHCYSRATTGNIKIGEIRKSDTTHPRQAHPTSTLQRSPSEPTPLSDAPIRERIRPTPTRRLRCHSCPAESSESVSVRMDGSPAKSCSALSLSVTH